MAVNYQNLSTAINRGKEVANMAYLNSMSIINSGSIRSGKNTNMSSSSLVEASIALAQANANVFVCGIDTWGQNGKIVGDLILILKD